MGSQRWQLPIAFALVAVGAISVGYYLNHFLTEQEFLIEQNRRIVRGLSKQAVDQVDGLAGVLRTAAGELYRARSFRVGKPFPFDAEERRERVARVAEAIDRSPSLRSFELRVIRKGVTGLPGRSPDLGTLEPTLSTHGEHPKLSLGPLAYCCHCAPGRPPDCQLSLEVAVDLDVLLEPLRHVRLFDEVLLTNAEGRVLHTVRDRSGNTDPFIHLDGLISTTKEPSLSTRATRAVASTPHRLLATVGGEDYWVILEPVPFRQLREVASDDDDPQAVPRPYWVVGGLVPADEFLEAARGVSTTWILLPAVALILAVVLLYPWIKLWNCAAYEPYARFELAWAGFAFLAFVGLLAAVLFDRAALGERSEKLDKDLESFSAAIESGFVEEVDMALSTLEGVAPKLSDVVGRQSVGSGFSLAGDVLGLETEAEERAGRVPIRDPGQPDPSLFTEYPYFNLIIWMDAEGQQRVKWSARGEPTPVGAYPDREYFARPRNGDLWNRDPEDRDPERRCVGYFIQPIHSRTTGERLAVISTGVDGSGKLHACGSKDPSPSVVTLVTHIFSLDRPITPPGLEFAVVEPPNVIRFHSDSDARFFEMLDTILEQDEDLHHALENLETLETRSFRRNYHGRRIHYHLRRLDQTPWTVIAVGTDGERESLNVEVLRFVSVAFVVYFASVLVAVLVAVGAGKWLFQIPLHSDTWLWAGPARTPAYLQLGLALASVSATALAAIGSPTFNESIQMPIDSVPMPLELIVAGLFLLAVSAAGLAVRSTWMRLARPLVLIAGTAAFAAWAHPSTPYGVVLTAAVGIALIAGIDEIAVKAAKRSFFLRGSAFVVFGIGLSAALGAVPIAILLERSLAETLADDARIDRDDFAQSADAWLERTHHSPLLRDRLADVCRGEASVDGWPVYLRGEVVESCLFPEAERDSEPAVADGSSSYSLSGGEQLFLEPAADAPGTRSTQVRGTHVLGLLVLGLAIGAVARRGLGLSWEWELDVKDRLSKSSEASWLHIGATDALGESAIDDVDTRQIKAIDMSNPMRWTSSPQIDENYVLLERFESVLGSAELRAKAVGLIAVLVGADKHIHIVCEVEPLRWLSDPTRRNQEDIQRDLPRWANLLSGFRVRHYEPDSRVGKSGRLDAKIQRECSVSPRLGKLAETLESLDGLRVQNVEDMVLGRARAEFVRLWELCTDHERAVLYLAAHGNIVSYPNRQVAAELLRRGLLVRDAGFWIASGAFRRFVIATVSLADETRWHKLAGAAGWHLWRNVLILLMALAVGFVFVTQRDIFVSIGALVAVLGGLPLIARLVSGIGSRTSES